MPRFFVLMKEATLGYDPYRGESVHSNGDLCKVSRLSIALLKYYRMVKLKLPLPISSKFKHSAVIRYFTTLGYIARDIYTEMREVYGNLISYNIVKRWCCEFLNGCTKIMDELCQG